MKKVEISTRLLLTLWGVGFILFLVAFAANIMKSEASLYWLIAAIAFTSSLWIIIMEDIIKNTVYNKSFWILSMIFFSIPIMFIYLIRRKKLLNYKRVIHIRNTNFQA